MTCICLHAEALSPSVQHRTRRRSQYSWVLWLSSVEVVPYRQWYRHFFRTIGTVV